MKCNHFNCTNESVNKFCSTLCESRFNQIEKRLKHKTKAVNYLGGRCKRCGFNEDIRMLNFHHLDPCDKKYDITKYLYKGLEFIKSELNKCVLLCYNCHLIVHKIKDPNYFIINNYFFSLPFENVNYNLIKDTGHECASNSFEKASIKKRNKLIPRELRIH